MVVWVTRGARSVHKTVVSLVAVDEDMKAFKFSGKSECLGGQHPWLSGLEVFLSMAMIACTTILTFSTRHTTPPAVTKFTQYENDLNRYIIIAFHFSAFVQIIVKSWLIVSSCDDLSAEANKFGIMLHRIDISDAGFNRQLRELSVKQCQNKFTMSAGGLFSINIPFITYIFCPVTAYTVFVYQLNN
ncbi:uncharacterized protein LOC124182050 isoform X2 [Neodiprion fabricii]|uniref:uncharacterized protein LOC124182050 isoform X2 n=1 Tax=Neodiprion fabricii TaxID=2872261 RepID=UPI001ED8CE6F|nr:uncharacterized protein LOC124182050 isoform X2 [Neodiprion fabricii]